LIARKPYPNQGAIADLYLWLNFIKHAVNSIFINLVVYCKEDFLMASDAYKGGLSGYNWKGVTWRWKLPLWMHGIFTINFLEFLVACITIWIYIPDMPPESCYLYFSDRPSTSG